MFWLIIDQPHELFMPHPEKDDRLRCAKRACLIVIIAWASVLIFG